MLYYKGEGAFSLEGIKVVNASVSLLGVTVRRVTVRTRLFFPPGPYPKLTPHALLKR